VRRAVTTDFKAPGDLIFIVGETRGELGGTRFERLGRARLGQAPSLRPAEAFRAYRRLHRAMRRGLVRSCHDLSDGGLWGALAESALGGRTGAAVCLDAVPTAGGSGRESERLLFCETPSRLLVSVSPRDRGRWGRVMAGVPMALIGAVAADSVVRVSAAGQGAAARDAATSDTAARENAAVDVEEIRRAWAGEGGSAT
jgi:phosphoribosylformylglycinamidine (FGAM) synthase-like enzyme